MKVKPGQINPSYRSKYMVLHQNRVQGYIALYSNDEEKRPLRQHARYGSMYDGDEEIKTHLPMGTIVKANMIIDI